MTDVIKVDGRFFDGEEVRNLIIKLNQKEAQLDKLQRQYQLEDTEIRKLKDKAERYDRLCNCLVEAVEESFEDKFEWKRN